MGNSTLLMISCALLIQTGACLNLKFACESTQLELKCPRNTVVNISTVEYGRSGYLATHVCRGKNWQQNSNCRAPNSFKVVSERCNGRQSCIVPASNSLFGDPCPDVEKILQVKYSCLKRVVACENEKAHVECPPGTEIETAYANFGRLSSEVCPGLNSNATTSCRTMYSRYRVGIECDYFRKCSVDATVRKFGGDLCRGVPKYLEIHYHCRKLPIREVVSCNGRSLNIQCYNQIHIDHAEFGRLSPDFCPGLNSTATKTCQASSALSRVKLNCQGRPNCSFRVSTDLFGEPCPGIPKYLLVRYSCERTRNGGLPAQ